MVFVAEQIHTRQFQCHIYTLPTEQFSHNSSVTAALSTHSVREGVCRLDNQSLESRGALKVFKRQWLPFTANAVGTATTALYDDASLLLS